MRRYTFDVRPGTEDPKKVFDALLKDVATGKEIDLVSWTVRFNLAMNQALDQQFRMGRHIGEMDVKERVETALNTFSESVGIVGDWDV